MCIYCPFWKVKVSNVVSIVQNRSMKRDLQNIVMNFFFLEHNNKQIELFPFPEKWMNDWADYLSRDRLVDFDDLLIAQSLFDELWLGFLRHRFICL